MSTHLNSSQDKEFTYAAMKMPRGDYKRWFARDKDGVYVGTEVPEREWTAEELRAKFGEFQDLALRSIPGGQEFGKKSRVGGRGGGKVMSEDFLGR